MCRAARQAAFGAELYLVTPGPYPVISPRREAKAGSFAASSDRPREKDRASLLLHLGAQPLGSWSPDPARKHIPASLHRHRTGARQLLPAGPRRSVAAQPTALSLRCSPGPRLPEARQKMGCSHALTSVAFLFSEKVWNRESRSARPSCSNRKGQRCFFHNAIWYLK